MDFEALVQNELVRAAVPLERAFDRVAAGGNGDGQLRDAPHDEDHDRKGDSANGKPAAGCDPRLGHRRHRKPRLRSVLVTEQTWDVDAAVAAVHNDTLLARAELEALVRIPSISADPEHDGDVGESADAVAALMEAAGLEHVRQAAVDGSPPCVIGEWLHAPDAPTILLYAHHDVQPPGYEERWSGDPFEPWERDGRLYGRGTADDKAGIMTHIAAVRAWLRTAGALPCNVKVMVEGEEEIGSPRLAPFLDDVRRGAEAPTSCCSPTPATGRSAHRGSPTRCAASPAATCVCAASRAHCTPAWPVARCPDPVFALAGLLASLVDEHGDPAFDGCWDDWVPAVRTHERARFAALPQADDRLRAAWGLLPGVELSGDPSVTVYERLWLPAGDHRHRNRRPPDQGVVEPDRVPRPRRASASESRPGQDPERLNAALHDHLARRVPFGLEFEFTPFEADTRVALRTRRSGVHRDRDRAARPRSASTPSTWASAARSRSSARSPRRSAASPRCCSAPPTPAAASTAKTRASTSATGQPHRHRNPPLSLF